MSGFNGELLKGLARLLDQTGVGVYDPTTPSAEDDLPAITLINLPQAPARVICLTDYPIAADPALTDVIIGVQVRVRGRQGVPLDPSDIRDAVYGQLHGLHQTRLPGGFYVVHMYWQSESPIGPDTTGRWERSINYYVHANRAGAEQE